MSKYFTDFSDCPSCGKTHRLVSDSRVPDSMAQLIFVCPSTSKEVRFDGIRAWDSYEMPDVTTIPVRSLPR